MGCATSAPATSPVDSGLIPAGEPQSDTPGKAFTGPQKAHHASVPIKAARETACKSLRGRRASVELAVVALGVLACGFASYRWFAYRSGLTGPAGAPGAQRALWPGGVTCERGHLDVFQITPRYCNASSHPEHSPPGCDPSVHLSKPNGAERPNWNSCTMICLPTGLRTVASRHGMRFGGTCFEPNRIEPETYGTAVVCPGAEYVASYAFLGIPMHTFHCAGGEVIDFGMPYK